MKAVLRRAEPDLDEELLVLGDVVVQRGAREVGVGGEPVELRPKEFDLLAYLIQNRGVVVSRELLLERVWGFDYAGGTRTVDVHVAQLRRTLGRPELIQTIRGSGYKDVQPSS
jgi:DNA-binding response OmpR family regulator